MAWSAGDSGDRLKDGFKQFITEWVAVDPYQSRMPDEYINIIKQGEKHTAGINIVLITKSEPQNSWTYTAVSGPDQGQGVIEEYHQIAILVKADQRAGGVESISKMISILQSLFVSRPESQERIELISAGIYNVFESEQGIDVVSQSEEEEADFYTQQINLTCNTETLIK